MRFLKTFTLLTLAVTLVACKKDSPSPEEIQAQMQQAAQVGQAQAIAEIIERGIATPCQPINLFNNIDVNNKKEINLINVNCESLNLPTIPAETTETSDEAETENSDTETTQ